MCLFLPGVDGQALPGKGKCLRMFTAVIVGDPERVQHLKHHVFDMLALEQRPLVKVDAVGEREALEKGAAIEGGRRVQARQARWAGVQLRMGVRRTGGDLRLQRPDIQEEIGGGVELQGLGRDKQEWLNATHAHSLVAADPAQLVKRLAK